MPARDKIHESVKKALTKDGWIIIYDPFRIDYQELTLFADLAAERIDGDQIEYKIVIEIKSFIGRSFIEDLQKALGQYRMYRLYIQHIAPQYQVYLALSEEIHKQFFNQQAIQLIVEEDKIALLIVNIEREEVVRWITP